MAPQTQLLIFAAFVSVCWGRLFQCGEMLIATDYRTEVKSPSVYSGRCTLKLKAERGIVWMQWLSFRVDGDMPFCDFNYVEVFLGDQTSKSIGKLCSRNLLGLPPDVYSTSGYITLVFKSQSSFNSFRISFQDMYNSPSLSPSSCNVTKGNVFVSRNWPVRLTQEDCSISLDQKQNAVARFLAMDFNLPSAWCDKSKGYITVADIGWSPEKQDGPLKNCMHP